MDPSELNDHIGKLNEAVERLDHDREMAERVIAETARLVVALERTFQQGLALCEQTKSRIAGITEHGLPVV